MNLFQTRKISYICLLIALVLINLLPPVRCDAVDCLPKDKCSCEFTDGRGIIDITSLGHVDNTPRFKDVYDDVNKVYYSYNPCGGFDEGECSNAAACVLTSDKSQQEQIGDAKDIMFKYDSGKVVAGYTAGTRILKLTQVHLTCDENACEPTFKSMGQTLNSYEMKMTTVCACPGMCDKNGPKNCKSSAGSGTLSIGVILIIVLISVVLIYFIGGMAYQKIRHKATGTDLIVHKEFFKSFPGLIKNGFLFTFGKCLPKRCVESYSSK